jgi:hypothetical protein
MRLAWAHDVSEIGSHSAFSPFRRETTKHMQWTVMTEDKKRRRKKKADVDEID